jgi:hypothetical protein
MELRALSKNPVKLINSGGDDLRRTSDEYFLESALAKRFSFMVDLFLIPGG